MSSPPRNSRFAKKASQKQTKSGRPRPSGESRPDSREKPHKSGQNRADRGGGGNKAAGNSRPRGPKGGKNSKKSGAQDLIWGSHAALAALSNPDRHIKEVFITPAASARLTLPAGISATTIEPSELDRIIGDAAHQGIAVRADPPKDVALDAIAMQASGLIVVLDQITDPHNVGAIFRLCAAFGARGLIMQDRKAPPMAGATAKVAVGCIETVPFALVSNIANTLLDLRERGWIVTGLAGEGELDIAQAVALPKNATAPANVIVMGAEGPGLRPRVRDCCDHLAKIHMPGGAESLNVSTAAAIAMYEAVRGQ